MPWRRRFRTEGLISNLAFVAILFSLWGMEQIPESDDLTPLHHHVMGMITDVSPSTLQAIFFECIERGPESLLVPIETEFSRRGLNAYGEYPESTTGI